MYLLTRGWTNFFRIDIFREKELIPPGKIKKKIYSPSGNSTFLIEMPLENCVNFFFSFWTIPEKFHFVFVETLEIWDWYHPPPWRSLSTPLPGWLKNWIAILPYKKNFCSMLASKIRIFREKTRSLVFSSRKFTKLIWM